MGKDFYALLIFDDRISLIESLQLNNICIYVIVFYTLISIFIISILYKQAKKFEDNYSFDEFQKQKTQKSPYESVLRNKNQGTEIEVDFNTQHTIHNDFYSKNDNQQQAPNSPR